MAGCFWEIYPFSFSPQSYCTWFSCILSSLTHSMGKAASVVVLQNLKTWQKLLSSCPEAQRLQIFRWRTWCVSLWRKAASELFCEVWEPARWELDSCCVTELFLLPFFWTVVCFLSDWFSLECNIYYFLSISSGGHQKHFAENKQTFEKLQLPFNLDTFFMSSVHASQLTWIMAWVVGIFLCIPVSYFK